MLREVRSMHFEVIRASGKFDYIINDLVPIIESMLDHDVEERPSAKQVRKACRSALDRANGVLEKDTNVLPEAFRMEPEVTLRSRKIPRVSGSPDQYGLGVVLPHRPHAPLATQSEPVTNGVYSTPYSNRAPGRNSKQRSIDTVFSDEKIQQTPELSDLYWAMTTRQYPAHHLRRMSGEHHLNRMNPDISLTPVATCAVEAKGPVSRVNQMLNVGPRSTKFIPGS
jgi:hypothetical protein